MDHIKLEQLDVDGAIRETAEAAGVDRADFLRKGLLGGAGFVAGGVLFNGLASPAAAAISTSRKSLANDIKIGNYALTLEYLEAEFYLQAQRNKAFASKDFEIFAATVYDHEAEHVKALKSILGSKAVKKPKFDFGKAVTDPATFAATAEVLEDTGVAAYAGQGPNIKTRSIVKAALSIHSVEARHAAWIRFLNHGGQASPGNRPSPRAFDPAAGEKRTLAAVTATGFIKG
jgi:Ferritin-like domain